MKLIFDCILTQTPDKCSTNSQFLTLAEKLLAETTDTFIYWPRPDRLTDEEQAMYPKSDRIKYIPLHQSKDRMKEYNRINPVLEDLLSFNGDTWDWDVLVTVRSTQIAMMRVIATSPRQRHRGWTKRIVLIEDMLVMSCKPTIALSNKDVQDRLCLEGYLAADKVLLPAYHEIPWIVEIAKRHFSPARVREIKNKITEVCHLNMPEYKLKTKFKFDGKRKLNVAFVGRLEKSAARLSSLNEIFTNQYIMRGEDVQSHVCTVTNGTRVIDPEITNYRHPKRAEFWKICEEELDLGVFFHTDLEISMSMLEPIALGVPEIVKKADWAVGMFGDDYPFYVDNEAQAYALITAFTKDYDKMYAKFAKWQKEWFVPTYNKRIAEDGLYKHLMDFITTPAEQDPATELSNLKTNEIVQLIALKGGDEFVLFDLIRALGKTDLRSLAKKVEEGSKEAVSMVFATPWNDFRLGLITFYGYEDASVKTGHLRKCT